MAALCLLFMAVNWNLFMLEDQLNERAVSIVLFFMIGSCYVQSVKIELSERVNRIWVMAGLFILPCVMVYIIEYLAGHNAVLLSANIFWLNYFWCQIVFLLFFTLTNHYRFTVIAGSVFCYIVGVVNYFVLQFRSSPLQLTDIMSVGTAADVAGNYVIALNYHLLAAGCAVLFAVCTAMHAKFHQKRRDWRSFASSIVLLVILLTAVTQFYDDKVWADHKLTMNFWNPLKGYEENGTTLSLAMAGKYLRPEKPDHYSAQRAEEIVKASLQAGVPVVAETDIEIATEQPEENEGFVSVTQEKPNIIAIMNESYADLSILGDFETTIPYMSFYESLQENTIRGNLSVSVLGGGTCNTEFEFLTGLTTAFLPSGSMAYQQYIKNNLDSMATILKDQGYKAVAYHPGKPDSWQRDQVYPYLGFEEFLTEKDMEDPEYMREAYVTDSSDYKEVIKLFEEKGDDKLFLFNVTIQNHGGYQLNTVDIPVWVSLENVRGHYPETEQYLSIMHASDEALQELITYFEGVQEPTLIVFFGDHQPSIEGDFVEELLGRPLNALSMENVQKRYQVPFFIWANYDIEEQYYDNISANYLSTLTLKTAGVELSAYNQYLDVLQQRLPMINALGYADMTGRYHNFSDKTAEQQWIEEYKIVQYNYLFGGNSRLSQLFQIEAQMETAHTAQSLRDEGGSEDAA